MRWRSATCRGCSTRRSRAAASPHHQRTGRIAAVPVADGQLLLLSPSSSGGGSSGNGGGVTRFGVVEHGGIVCTLARGDAVPPSFDGCSHV